jgi:hypothetical protein
MDIDHVFVLVEPHSPLIATLSSMGLVETYRRQHTGQGTANVCFCFENMFLELLWVTSAVEVQSARIRRMRLFERAQWATTGACPVGVAWRNTSPTITSSCALWPYQPPYLTPGAVISVAVDSDDPKQPMMFTFPGATPPREWHAARQGQLQSAAGMVDVVGVTLAMPKDVVPSHTLATLVRETSLSLTVSPDATYGVELQITQRGHAKRLRVPLPLGRVVRDERVAPRNG